MVGTFRDLAPGTDQLLKLREGGMDLPGQGGFLRLLSDDLDRQLLDVTQERRRELDDLDLPHELRLELLERDGVLGVEVRTAIDVRRRHRLVERPPQISRERVVRLLVEAELEVGPGLVPARVVIV